MSAGTHVASGSGMNRLASWTHLATNTLLIASLISGAMLACTSRPATEPTAAAQAGGNPDPLPASPVSCSADGWCWEHPGPVGNGLRGITVTPAGEHVVVGAGATIL